MGFEPYSIYIYKKTPPKPPWHSSEVGSYTPLFIQHPFATDDTELMQDDPKSQVKFCQQDRALRSMITDFLSIYGQLYALCMYVSTIFTSDKVLSQFDITGLDWNTLQEAAQNTHAVVCHISLEECKACFKIQCLSEIYHFACLDLLFFF